jgi:hypothetical protein
MGIGDAPNPLEKKRDIKKNKIPQNPGLLSPS